MAIVRELADWSAQIAVLLFVTSTIAQPFVIPSGSMEGTLMTGDHVIVDKLVYSPPGSLTGKLLPYRAVERGDIIVFRYPLDMRENYVKRVIGVPGDRIHLENGAVVRNGEKLDEPYIRHLPVAPNEYRDNFPVQPPGLPEQAVAMLRNHVENGEVVVPQGQYFAMGDNRDNSSDSRYWGFVPRENIVGTPWVVYWSYDAPTEELVAYKLSHFVDLGLHFFSKTRWERTLHFVHRNN